MVLLRLIQAQTPEQIGTARQLFEEYAAALEVDLCFQNFEKELAELPGGYAPPRGRLLLAYIDDQVQVCGCVALRRIGEGTCEMKRLYLKPDFRGKGLGRKLAGAIIDEARQMGYERMRLDTLPGKMDAAIAMYRSFGFNEIPPYTNSVEGALFMELEL